MTSRFKPLRLLRGGPWDAISSRRPRVSELTAEMELYTAQIDQLALEHLFQMGLTSSALASVGQTIPPIGLLGLQQKFFVQPVLSGGDIVDLIAWHAMDPWLCWSRTGLTCFLGEDSLQYRDPAEHLILHCTPFEWLCGGGAGICILKWESPCVRRLLSVEVIEAAHPLLGKRLLRSLSIPPRLPKFVCSRHAH